MVFLSQPPSIVRPLAGDLLWRVDTLNKEVYLTFDDGPTPGVSNQVMSLLDTYGAKGTFFCVGQQVEKHPNLFQELLDRGHSIGNHSYNHNNGWKTNNFSYFKSYLQCHPYTSSRLYRPPYGKITRSQAKTISSRSQIVMWDVLSGDYDQNSSPEVCLKRVKKNVREGSIVVFHDSIKAQKNLLYALEGSLDYLQSEAYVFCAL